VGSRPVTLGGSGTQGTARGRGDMCGSLEPWDDEMWVCGMRWCDVVWVWDEGLRKCGTVLLGSVVGELRRSA
jgi:hypothetical protein